MNKKIVLFSLLVATVIGGLISTSVLSPTPTATAAQSDYFLKLDGIEANSSNGIEVNSWSFGATNTSVSNGGGGLGSGVGKVSRKGFTITKTLDKATPMLYSGQVSGKRIKTATFTAGIPGSSSKLTITMSDVTISSYTVAGSQGEAPMETVSFNYSKIEFKY